VTNAIEVAVFNTSDMALSSTFFLSCDGCQPEPTLRDVAGAATLAAPQRPPRLAFKMREVTANGLPQENGSTGHNLLTFYPISPGISPKRPRTETARRFRKVCGVFGRGAFRAHVLRASFTIIQSGSNLRALPDLKQKARVTSTGLSWGLIAALTNVN
jgi:hypothetical protein